MFRQSFFSLNIRDWLCFNLGKAGINEIMDDWACLFGITNLSSHIMHLAALKWSLKFNLGFMTSIMQNQASISFVVEKSSKKLTGKLPLNHFSN